MDPLKSLAEKKLEEAVRDGLFDDLPGAGRPLELEDLSSVPEDLRAGTIVLRSAGYLPEELVLHQEVRSLGQLLEACTDQGERTDLQRRWNARVLQLELMLERSGVRRALGPETLRVLRERFAERSDEKQRSD